MANKRIHDLDDTATTLDSGAYFAVDSDSYTAAKKFAADSLQTAVDIGGLTPTDGNFIVGDGSAWVAESGATVRASMGLGTMATEAATSYLAATGATTGATSQAQDFTSGLTVAGGSNGISAAGVVTGTRGIFTKPSTTGTTVIGTSAGNSATGNDWLAIGDLAGYANTTGVSWSAIGKSAGSANTTGNYWLAVGVSAARNNTTGSSWTAFGVLSASASTTGGSWSAFGNSAGYANTTGGSWIAIGVSAGRYTNAGGNAETNANFVAIGNDARFSADGTSNEIVIGYQGRGNGSNTTTIGNSSTTHFYGLGIHVLPSGGAPASAAATGTAGSIVWDADYIYICTATDTWKRAAISTWA